MTDQSQTERGYVETLLQSFEEEDARWSTEAQLGDWLKLGLMIAVNFAWMIVVFAFEPGLR